MALFSSNMRTGRNGGITLIEISFWRREWECQLKRTGWQKPNHVLTMFSGRPLCQWNGKCQSKWNHGNLVAYAIKKKLANERQPNSFRLLVTLTTFFFSKSFFQTSFSSFFFTSIFYHNTQTSTTLSPHDCY